MKPLALDEQKDLTVRSSLLLVKLKFSHKKPVMVAIPVKHPLAPQLQPGLSVALRVKFYQLYPVAGTKGQEGNKMGFGHRVGECEKMFVLHFFNAKAVGLVLIFGLQCRQGNAAAADDGAAGAVDHIPANRANIKFGTQHIC